MIFLWLQLIQASRINFPDFPFFDGLEEQFRDKKSVGKEPILPCPNGEAFCESNVEDYPSNIDILDEIVASKLVRNVIFDEKPRLSEDLLERTAFEKESRVCDNRKATVYPKKAQNIQGKYVFIVNDNKYRQAVSIEQCLGESEPCLNDNDAPEPSTVCRQKYATYRMYVINEEGEQVYDSFSLPSACLCHHKSNFAIRNAFKASLDSPPLPVCPGQEKLSVSTSTTSSTTSTTTSTSVERITSSPKPPRKVSSGGFRFGDRKKRDAGIFGRSGSCESGSYCEDNSAYPSDIILKAVTENNELNPDLFSQLFDNQCKSLQSRFSSIDEEQLCYGVPKVIFPRQAKNLKEEWKYIVNIENYTQSVEVEECYDFNQDLDTTTPNSDGNNVQFGQAPEIPKEFGSCLYSGAVGNNPDLTNCKQLYTEHKLLALSDNGQLEVDSFKLPSACACFYKEDFVLAFRGNMPREEDEIVKIELPDQVEETLRFD